MIRKIIKHVMFALGLQLMWRQHFKPWCARCLGKCYLRQNGKAFYCTLCGGSGWAPEK